jgi:type IV secretory pathway VirB10-like protein
MVNAIVVSPREKDRALAQLDYFAHSISQTRSTQPEQTQSEQTQSEPIQSEPIQSEPIQSEPIQSEQTQSKPIQSEPIQPGNLQLDNLDRRLEAIAAQLRDQRTDLNSYVADLQRANREALANKHTSLLAEINALTGKALEKRLRCYDFKPAVIAKLVAARRNTKGFADYKELEQRVDGLGAAGLLGAIAKWERINQPDDMA